MTELAALAERFWAKVERHSDSECWPWLAYKDPEGYGRFQVTPDRSDDRAHRVAYRLLYGPIPDGIELDHLCRNPACVNPLHLEAVDHRTNVLRGVGTAAVNARKSHCIRGHPLSGENLSMRSGRRGQERHCRTCARDQDRLRKRVSRARQVS
jgi:hypothetical protein